MSNLNLGLVSAMLCAGLAVGGAFAATTLYSGSCYNTSAEPGNGFYIVDYGLETVSSYHNITASDIYGNCTAGQSYKIYPVKTVIFTGTDLYGTIGVVYSCTSCADGYELVERNATPVWGSANYKVECTSFTNMPTLYLCQKTTSSGGSTTTACNSSNCASDSGWTPVDATYVYRTKRECSSDGTTCNESTEYACNWGYYGTIGSSSKTGCNACPPFFTSAGNSYETTTAMFPMSTISGCYVKATGDVTEFKDISGTFVFTPYSNATTRCYYDLGACASFTDACSTSSGTAYAVVSGTTTNNTSGQYCWCNANSKTFFMANMGNATTCVSSCTSACTNAMVGFSGNGYQAMVSLEALGCF